MVARSENVPNMPHSAEIHSVAVETEGTVGHRAFEDGGTHVAEVLATGRAVATGAAVGDEATHDMVARLDLRDAWADLFDDARAFVSADDRVTRREITVGQVQIRMAQSGSGVYLISTSPTPGPSRSSSMISKGFPGSSSTAALVFTGDLLDCRTRE